MSMPKSLSKLLAVAAFAASAVAIAAPGQWYFYVENGASSKITSLEVSQDGRQWGKFNIGSGIPAGATEKLVWDSSTDNQSCEQFIRAKFSDGNYSTPSKMDFCQNLDDPIVFSD